MKSTFNALTDDDKKLFLETMKSYSDTAKSFTQLAVAALVLPIVFARQIFAVKTDERVPVDWFLLLIWSPFLLATGLGLLYQYLAVKFLSANFWKEDWDKSFWLVRDPGYVFGAIMIAFFFGAILFVVRAYLRLLGNLQRTGDRPSRFCAGGVTELTRYENPQPSRVSHSRPSFGLVWGRSSASGM